MADTLNLPYGTKKWVINFYYEQLEYFNKVGLGKYTTHNIKVTPELIKVTQKRLAELCVIYDAKLTPQAKKLQRIKREKLLNGSTNSNGTADTTVSKNIRTNGHESSRS